MARKFFKRVLPSSSSIRDHKHLKVFGKVLQDANLWHLNRHSVARAFSIGLFCAFIPVPFQMVLAGAMAIAWRANMVISVVLVWITNPLTWGPIYYGAYLVGAKITDTPIKGFKFSEFEFTMASILKTGWVFLLGCFICGVVSAVVSNLIIRLFWRWSVSRAWSESRARIRNKARELLQLKNKS